MEKVLWFSEHAKSGLLSFMLEISCWTMLHGRPVEVDDDQIKTLTENNQRYTMQKINLHTENIQIKYWKPFVPARLC